MWMALFDLITYEIEYLGNKVQEKYEHIYDEIHIGIL